MFFDLDPTFRALGIDAPVGWSDFAIDRGLFAQLGNFDPRGDIPHLLFRELSGAPRYHEAPQPFRTPRGIIERNEPAACHSYQVELVEVEIARERIEICGHAAGLWPGRGIGQAFAPAAAVKGDDAIAFSRESDCLGVPARAGPGVGMQQHDRDAGASGVREPQFDARKLRKPAGGRILGSANRHRQNQRQAEHRRKSPPSPANALHVFPPSKKQSPPGHSGAAPPVGSFGPDVTANSCAKAMVFRHCLSVLAAEIARVQ